MDHDQGHTASNAKPQGVTMPATIIEPIVSGITQRTEHKIAFTTTSTRSAGENMRVVGED
ncbi:MAG: hypothetical protein OXU37_04770 [Thaumarchaeota archaeon]|nr:hypothetical protein [Nitrososphaerota archaeon]MDD9843199.1 hypothetical protein [Nitrososphaerota archaeon]RNJ71827.1 MAG: hypothetical protein EB833_06170 [Thaumarchaeota archaeon S13]RNJ75116.1 MAG: hypothetical protein EB824_02230 [Thaumarchaeota archaeon S15]